LFARGLWCESTAAGSDPTILSTGGPGRALPRLATAPGTVLIPR
jgi:hypothetical protein